MFEQSYKKFKSKTGDWLLLNDFEEWWQNPFQLLTFIDSNGRKPAVNSPETRIH